MINIDKWISKHINNRKKEEQNEIKKSYLFAIKYEQNIFNKNKNLKIGLKSAEILKSFNLDKSSLMTAIIYNTYCFYNLSINTIKIRLGNNISELIIGLKKIDSINIQEIIKNKSKRNIQKNLQNIRNMLLSITDDIRIIFIKLALHTSTLKINAKLYNNITNTLNNIYISLANRLGIKKIKCELEDIAFRYNKPSAYKHIVSLINEKHIDREKYIKNIVYVLINKFKKNNIKVKINSRIKHIYGIWQKMKRKMIDFSKIYDNRAIRLIVKEITDCYKALNIIHSLWNHIQNEFNDYIMNPKKNGYQSIHTTIIGPEKKIIEIQIRTIKMHNYSELGIASHWRYKENIPYVPEYENQLKILRKIIKSIKNKSTIKKTQKINNKLLQNNIYIFTPNKDIIKLPLGSTPIDFAYKIHTEIGHQCIGAKVNNKIISLNKKLQNGSKVYILTSKKSHPSKDWLNKQYKFFKKKSTKIKIQHWFNMQNKNNNIIKIKNRKKNIQNNIKKNKLKIT